MSNYAESRCVLFVPLVLNPLLELAFQVVDRHGVYVTHGIRLLIARLHDLLKQALEQCMEVLAAECL